MQTKTKLYPSASEAREANLLIVPIGAFEQHGAHLPLATDTLIATVLAEGLAKLTGGLMVPAIPVSCSHEHAAVGVTICADAIATFQYLQSIIDHAFRSRFTQIAIINGHGGNYFLQNLVQQYNEKTPRVYLGPNRVTMEAAFSAAGIKTTVSDDMHGGEYETSVLLEFHRTLVDMTKAEDTAPKPRPLLNMLGMREYTENGIIGNPTLATAQKGKLVVREICRLMAQDISLLRGRL